jgi:hypothetical protein
MKEITTGPEWTAFVGEVAAAIRDENNSKWAVGDVLVRRTSNGARAPFAKGQDNGSSKWIAAMVRDLESQGVDTTYETLRTRYTTSTAFPADTRIDGVSWTVHRLMAAYGGAAEAPARMGQFIEAMKANGQPTSRRNAEEWLGRTPAGDSADAVVRKIGDDAEAAAAVVRKIAETHPQAVAQTVSKDAAVAKAVADDSGARLAVTREVNKSEDANTVRFKASQPEPEMGLPALLLPAVITGEARDLVRALAAVNMEGKQFTDNARVIVNGYADEAIALLNTAKQIVNGEVRTHLTEDDFAALLGGAE